MQSIAASATATNGTLSNPGAHVDCAKDRHVFPFYLALGGFPNCWDALAKKQKGRRSVGDLMSAKTNRPNDQPCRKRDLGRKRRDRQEGTGAAMVLASRSGSGPRNRYIQREAGPLGGSLGARISWHTHSTYTKSQTSQRGGRGITRRSPTWSAAMSPLVGSCYEGESHDHEENASNGGTIARERTGQSKPFFSGCF